MKLGKVAVGSSIAQNNLSILQEGISGIDPSLHKLSKHEKAKLELVRTLLKITNLVLCKLKYDMTFYKRFIETLVLACTVNAILTQIDHKDPNWTVLTFKMTLVIPHL